MSTGHSLFELVIGKQLLIPLELVKQ
ncbi:unnamed protein product [Spirodela intermedia]|uniref:Uncharacterized protein n=2 Tax=Spirodela intermedia TaxID=51605 RepID=A0A7I8LK88_SPIIN|nr:unnamed protein product [Spirodela intermedia]CAA6673261.1 unnamed protein product [Spirodela intermedia]CAA7410483.1 unnamed protein product [Spirodela intermedia]